VAIAEAEHPEAEAEVEAEGDKQKIVAVNGKIKKVTRKDNLFYMYSVPLYLFGISEALISLKL
jgi:hypothetical protein